MGGGAAGAQRTVRQIANTLDEELLQFLDQWGGNRSAAIAEAVRCRP